MISNDNESKEAVRKKRRKKKRTSQTKRKAVEASEIEIYIAGHHWLTSGETLAKEIEEYSEKKYLTKKSKATALADMHELAKHNNRKMKHLLSEFKMSSNLTEEHLATIDENNKASPPNESRLSNLIFTAFLLLLVFILSLGGADKGSGPPKNIAGYAPLTILTGSMASVYPPNSLVIAKVTNPKELKIGDDITYMRENNSTVTHRIVGIDENYLGTNKRGFETKGTENPRKDEEIVRAENVIGKIVFSSMTIGKMIKFVRENMVLTAITLLLIIWLSDALIKYIKLRKEEKKNDTIN